MNKHADFMWKMGILLTVIFTPIALFAQATNLVLDLTVSAEIRENGSTKITEAILYDFGSSRHHGIFRNLPLHRQEGSALYRYEYRTITVTDKEGNPIPFETIKEKSFLRLKIGEEHILISGVMEYRISYEVENLMRGFEKYDDWIWDVTSSNWPLQIRRSRLSVRFPKELLITDLIRSCATEPSTDKNAKETCQVGFLDRTASNTTQSIQTMDLNLQPKEKMVVSLAFPKGTFKDIPNAKTALTKPSIKMSAPQIAGGTLMLILVGVVAKNFIRGKRPEWVKE